jgi:hypothetical protein
MDHDHFELELYFNEICDEKPLRRVWTVFTVFEYFCRKEYFIFAEVSVIIVTAVSFEMPIIIFN